MLTLRYPSQPVCLIVCLTFTGSRHQTQQGPQGAQERAKEPGYLPEAPGKGEE